MIELGSVKNYMTENAIIGLKEDTLLHIMEIMIQYNIRHVPVINENLKLYRILTDGDLINLISEKPTLENLRKTVGSMESQLIVTIQAEDAIEKAITTMARYRISSLPILKRGLINGILTMKDIVFKNNIWEYMEDIEIFPHSFPTGHDISQSIAITLDFSLWQLLDRLREDDVIRNLLVFDKRGKVVGVVNSSTIFFEVINYKRRVKQLHSDMSFEEYLFTTTLEEVMIPLPITVKAPVRLLKLRQQLCDSNGTAILIADERKTHSVITERDLFYYLHSSINQNQSSHSKAPAAG